MQIIHKEYGTIAEWAPGFPVETDMLDDLVSRIKAKGVGLLKTESQVVKAVEAAYKELLWDLKSRVHYAPLPKKG